MDDTFPLSRIEIYLYLFTSHKIKLYSILLFLNYNYRYVENLIIYTSYKMSFLKTLNCAYLWSNQIMMGKSFINSVKNGGTRFRESRNH